VTHSWAKIALPWVLWGTLVASALAIAPGVLFHYDVSPKVASILLGAAFAMVLVSAWIDGLSPIVNSWPGKVFLLALGVQAVSVVLSTLMSGDPALSVTGSAWRRLGLIAEIALLGWLIAAASWTANSVPRILLTLRAISLAGLAGGIYGVAQYFGFDPLLPADAYHVGEGYWTIVRPPGTLGHAGYFATFLLHGVFAGAALTTTEPTRKWKVLGLAAASTSAVAIVLSGTRSAMVGLAVGALFLVVWFRPKITARTVVLTAALAAAIAIFYFTPPGERLRARTRWYVEDSAGGGRLWLWRDAWKLGADRWPAGTGLETFSTGFLAYQSLELTHTLPDRYYESPHNIFLDAWASQGIAGLAALMGLVAAAGFATIEARRLQPRLAGCLAAGMLAALAAGWFLPFVAVTKLYFYAQMALLVALAAQGRAKVFDNRIRLAGRVSTVAAAVVFSAFAFQLIRADWLLEKVRQAVLTEKPESAIPLYQRFSNVKPVGMYADLWFSREMLRAATGAATLEDGKPLWDAGKAAAYRATGQTETPQSAWYNLATFQAQEGDVYGAEESLRAALQAAPAWYKPYWMLAQLLDATNQHSEALQHIERALELTDGDDEAVRATWEDMQPHR
jgi:O-antigen ligase